MSETVPVLRGDPLTIRIENLTLDGLVWSNVDAYNAVAHVRASERSELAAEFTVTEDNGDLVLTLSAEDTESLTRPLYLWDVEFTDPDTSEPFTWPGPGEPRHRLTVTSDVTRVEVAP